MKHRILTFAAGLTFAVLISFLQGNTARADDYDDVANSLYEQLVTGKKNKAVVETDAHLDRTELTIRLLSIDDPDNLYDGPSILQRGQGFEVKEYQDAKGNTIGYKAFYDGYGSAYDIDEADALTDEIAAELLKKVGEKASVRAKAYALFDYEAGHFYYEKDQQELMEPFTKILSEGKTGLICQGYANITYLVANKMGVPCRYVTGVEHVYNALKIGGKWIYVDCTSGDRCPFVFQRWYDSDPQYDISNWKSTYNRAIDSAVNEASEGEPAPIFEVPLESVYWVTHGQGTRTDVINVLILIALIAVPIIIILLVFLIVKKIRKKKKTSGIDLTGKQAVLHCSICNGEQVAGFKDLETGKFEEVMLIRNDSDLEKFKRKYGVTEVTKEY